MPASKQQHPPKNHKDIQYIRITHPGHPLTGQIVHAIRQAGLSKSGEMQWVIEMENKSRFAIPLDWAKLVNNLDQECSTTTTAAGLLVDTKSYLDLAKMIYRIKMNQPEEVQPHETSSLCTPAVSVKTPSENDEVSHISTGMGQIAISSETRNDTDVSQYVGKTATNHSAKRRRAK